VCRHRHGRLQWNMAAAALREWKRLGPSVEGQWTIFQVGC
jgi:hypothetical protein